MCSRAILLHIEAPAEALPAQQQNTVAQEGEKFLKGSAVARVAVPEGNEIRKILLMTFSGTLRRRSKQ
jgi:hypothetical protein